MQYLVTSDINPPYLTDWFDAENHFVDDINMVVYDLLNEVFTTNGQDWQDIAIDSL